MDEDGVFDFICFVKIYLISSLELYKGMMPLRTNGFQGSVSSFVYLQQYLLC